MEKPESPRRLRRKARLLEIIQEAGSASVLAAEIGTPKSHISALVSGSRGVGDDLAAKIEKHYKKPEGWFDSGDMSGSTTIRFSASGTLTDATETTSNISAARAYSGEVPVINWVQAGAWQEVAEAVEPERFLPIFKGHSSNSYALRVRGDSMTAQHGKSYPDGCFIIVDPAKVSPVNGDRVVAKLKGVAEATFKVFKNEDGTQWLAPLNPMHKPIYDNFTVVGTIIGKWEDE